MKLRTQGGFRVLFFMLRSLNSRPQGAIKITLITHLRVRSVSE